MSALKKSISLLRFSNPLGSFKFLGTAIVFATLSACASSPNDSPVVDANSVDYIATLEQVASLEAEVARLKSQNARLSNEVLALQRDKDRLALEEANPEPELPPKPEMIVTDEPSKQKAVVDDAPSPALAQSEVPVETSPRLVQPTFASNETVFENEAEGDIKTESVLFGVHLASYRKPDEARAGWRQLQRENPEELGLLEPRIESVAVTGKGNFVRLVGGGFASRDKAEALCLQLKSRGLFCSVTGFEGERLSLAEDQG
ncbi:SPOR domain-containing protein [Hyphococcus sp. DH-69]|uniref:SPOR domain-containing protein n=1 Tax=Hyphococcus formosus TaxID=3143534 RepID=UPI00398A98E1